MDATANAAILQNLADGHWPISWLSLRRSSNSVTTTGIAQLFQIALSGMECLSLGGLFLGTYA